MPRRLLTHVLIAAVFLSASTTGHASTSPRVAALEATLCRQGFYVGAGACPEGVDGQVRARWSPRSTSGPDGEGTLGRRILRAGDSGVDVAEFQLALAWRGFPSGPFDGRFGARLTSALRRFQRSLGRASDGVVSAATLAALHAGPPRAPYSLGWPVLAPIGDRFGPRGNRFHAGIDLLSPGHTRVIASAAGRVVWAGLRPGGWGYLVTIAHDGGVRTIYAHLSEVAVKLGEFVSGATVIGRVGATGDATGPHLHFEVRINGAAVDPLAALVALHA